MAILCCDGQWRLEPVPAEGMGSQTGTGGAQASPPIPQSLWPSLNFSQTLDGPDLGPDTPWSLFMFFLWSCLSVRAHRWLQNLDKGTPWSDSSAPKLSAPWPGATATITVHITLCESGWHGGPALCLPEPGWVRRSAKPQCSPGVCSALVKAAPASGCEPGPVFWQAAQPSGG